MCFCGYILKIVKLPYSIFAKLIRKFFTMHIDALEVPQKMGEGFKRLKGVK